MTENELSAVAVDISLLIHRTLGPGLLESVYESVFAFELEQRQIQYSRQKGIRVHYGDTVLDCGFRADLILENKLLIELKSVERIDPVHHKIVLTYLKLSGIKLGLLINFNVELMKDGIYRKIQGSLK